MIRHKRNAIDIRYIKEKRVNVIGEKTEGVISMPLSRRQNSLAYQRHPEGGKLNGEKGCKELIWGSIEHIEGGIDLGGAVKEVDSRDDGGWGLLGKWHTPHRRLVIFKIALFFVMVCDKIGDDKRGQYRNGSGNDEGGWMRPVE